MNYRSYTRPNPFGGHYVILEIDGENVYEKYCGSDFGTRWHAFWLNEKAKNGKLPSCIDPNFIGYEGTVKK